jgi:serine/threonine/tyrosine-interacting protein
MSSDSSLGEVPMSLDSQSPYVRTQEYISTPRYSNLSGTPGGPPYRVPYGIGNNDSDNSTVIVDAKIFNRDTHDFAEGDFVCQGFFNRVDLGGFTRRFNVSQWNYEMRRQAQSVLPFLSLGPLSCLRDIEYVRSQGFTLLLAIRSRKSAPARLVSGDKAAAAAGIMADTVDVLDNQELISEFPRAIRRINDHLAGEDENPNAMALSGLQQKRKVLVFCESGNERSAAVVIAYVMVMLNINAAEATYMIQQRRFCASIEDPMKRILAAFESILSAKRDVERARHTIPPHIAATLAPPSSSPILTKKRSFQDHRNDDHLMDDDEMEVDGDGDPFFERKPSAPFQDRVV